MLLSSLHIAAQNAESPFLSDRFCLCHRLAVRSVGLLGDDTLVDEVNVRPVVSLGTLAIDSGGRVGNGGPERSTGHILLPGVTLSVEQGLASSNVQSVVVLKTRVQLAYFLCENGTNSSRKDEPWLANSTRR